jgi:hypothetical protein
MMELFKPSLVIGIWSEVTPCGREDDGRAIL